MVTLLVDSGAEVEAESEWGHTPFEWAATVGAREAALRLLDAGAERLGLWTAAALGLADQVESAWEPSADVDHAFYLACRHGHTGIAEFLMERGADPNAKGYFDAPAIHWAAHNGHAETVRWLLSSGADPSLLDPEFEATASGWAREGGHAELAAELATVEG